MREPHLSVSAPSAQPSSTSRSTQKVPIQIAPSPTGMAKEENLKDQKSSQQGRPLADLVDRIDYFDRGKAFSGAPNGYGERNDAYIDRREESTGG